MDTLTLPVQPIWYKRKAIDTGVILGKRPFPRSRFYYSAKVDGKNISKPSPHQKDITIYIPIDQLMIGTRFIFRKKEDKIEIFDLKIVDIGNDFIMCAVESYQEEKQNWTPKPLKPAYHFSEDVFRKDARGRTDPEPLKIGAETFYIKDHLRDQAYIWVDTLHKFLPVKPCWWGDNDHVFMFYPVRAVKGEIKIDQNDLLRYDALTGKPTPATYAGIFAPRYQRM